MDPGPQRPRRNRQFRVEVGNKRVAAEFADYVNSIRVFCEIRGYFLMPCNRRLVGPGPSHNEHKRYDDRKDEAE